MPPPKVICGLGISLDGYIAAPDGSVDFLNELPKADYGFNEFMKPIRAMVMGRTTFDHALRMGGSFGGSQKVRSIVMTSRPIDNPPKGLEVWPGDPASLVTKLRPELDGDIWHMGGGKLIRSFLEAGLIDEFELGVAPVILGAGIPLFPPGCPKVSLELVHQSKFSNGVVGLKYHVKRG